MKPILLIQESLPFHGGVARTFERLARQLPREMVHIGTLIDTPDSILPWLVQEGSPIINLGSKRNPLVALQLRRYLLRHRVAIVFACSFRSYLAAKAAAAGLRCQVAFWASDFSLMSKPLRIALFRWISRNDWLVCISKAILSAHCDGHKKAAVLYSGVEAPARMDHVQARKELGLPQDNILLLYAADSKPYKDHVTLLKAFRILSQERPALLLLLCGNPGKLPEWIHDPDICGPPFSRCVMHVGIREDMSPLYSAADIYVHPCYIEGFGIAVVEAMLAGLPVVAARAGGLPEAVGDEGILFEPRNPEALAKSLEALLSEPERRKQLALRGQAMALERFRLEGFGERFMDVCQHILEESS